MIFTAWGGTEAPRGGDARSWRRTSAQLCLVRNPTIVTDARKKSDRRGESERRERNHHLIGMVPRPSAARNGRGHVVDDSGERGGKGIGEGARREAQARAIPAAARLLTRP